MGTGILRTPPAETEGALHREQATVRQRAKLRESGEGRGQVREARPRGGVQFVEPESRLRRFCRRQHAVRNKLKQRGDSSESKMQDLRKPYKLIISSVLRRSEQRCQAG